LIGNYDRFYILRSFHIAQKGKMFGFTQNMDRPAS
jgi:hypothetical protein